MDSKLIKLYSVIGDEIQLYRGILLKNSSEIVLDNVQCYFPSTKNFTPTAESQRRFVASTSFFSYEEARICLLGKLEEKLKAKYAALSESEEYYRLVEKGKEQEVLRATSLSMSKVPLSLSNHTVSIGYSTSSSCNYTPVWTAVSP
ncbi:MAG: hypothetical protein KDH96_08210 [Candidatus Riesia sp.]|nr:hypothetical protein [Candidatus Riesia sp.]